MRLGWSPASNAVYTPALLTCLCITAAIHAATYSLSVMLPLHVVALGGSKTEIGMLFSITAMTSMFLRPLAGGWIDRYGVRPVLLPGVLALAVTSLGFQAATTPVAVVALMAGMGVSNGLIATPAGVLAAQATAPIHRGEALSVYYVATSAAMAVGAPAGFALFGAGGARLNFLVVTAVAVLIAGLALSPAMSTPLAAAPQTRGLKLYSRHAVPAACALILVNLGNSSLYAFVPLYAIQHGRGRHVGWFFALFSVWLVACRFFLRGISDRLGRSAVLVPAMGAIALGFFVLTLPPTVVSLAVSALLMGSGVSLLYPTLVALVVDRTPEAERGLAIGTLSGSFDLGVVAGSALIGLVVEHTSYGAGFAVGGAAAILGLLTFVATERWRAGGGVRHAPASEV